MHASDYVFFDGLNKIWVEPITTGLPVLKASRILIGWILEPAEDEGKATVQLRKGFELSGERMLLEDIVDEILGSLEDDPEITITVTMPTPLVPEPYWDL